MKCMSCDGEISPSGMGGRPCSCQPEPVRDVPSWTIHTCTSDPHCGQRPCANAPQVNVTGLVAAHPDHNNAIIVFLSDPLQRKFQAGERVRVRTEPLDDV